MRKALILLAAVLPLPASGFQLPWAAPAGTAPAAPRPVVSVIVEDIPSERPSYPGVVLAATEVTLGFQTLGRLFSRPVDVGDRVVTGQLLAKLTPDDLQDNVRAARAAVDNAEVTLETARTAANRVRDLVTRRVATQAQLEQAERSLTAAAAGLDQARSELARAEDAEGFARLTAPFDGVISAVFENAGAVVNAGTPIVTLSDTVTQEAVIDLPEAALSGLPVGTGVTIRLEADPATVTTGHVSRIEPLADAATRTRRVYLAMDETADFRLNSLIRAQRADATGSYLSLPASAIAGTDDAPAVWVVTRDGETAHVSERRVVIAPGLDSLARITEGISPGEEVVVRGAHSLTEGQPVGRSIAP
ncbi:MAG: efflux RND transporter periplasmic adaptor subunit [Paracoccus sp. (in: a-proteobacteria)]|nr:efflux RND transporter periplasmic adaptor subunit [Paracoccus sp. (in: a-proteobacteria)]